MTTGLWIAVVAVVVALGLGAHRKVTDGSFRKAPRVDGSVVDEDQPTGEAWKAVLASLPAAELGQRATLLQFSSAFCAPCRTTRQVLQGVASAEPGVTHIEVDAEHHLGLVRALDVLRTPTTLVLDHHGHEVTRAAGAPRREQVLSALDRV